MLKHILSKENSLILRGVAIVVIILHNFLHLPRFGFSSDNEMFFMSANAMAFYKSLSGGTNVFYEFLSHLGWIGVPVFVFLTGYGVSFSGPIYGCKIVGYIKKNYLKLLTLMLPAVVFYAGIDVLKGDIWPDLLKRASYLTLLVNFAVPYLKCSPGVYWYFSLTFQFYLLWALFGRYMNGKRLLMWSVILLAGLYVLSVYGSPDILSIYKHCFTGWFPVFAIGVWLGLRKRDEEVASQFDVWTELLIFSVMFGLILLMSRWMVTWLFVPIIALVWFLVVGMLLLRTRYLSDIFRWIGRYSACLFVCHPIARTIVLNTVYSTIPDVLFNLMVYLAFSFIIALLYDKLYKWLHMKMVPRIEFKQ